LCLQQLQQATAHAVKCDSAAKKDNPSYQIIQKPLKLKQQLLR